MAMDPYDKQYVPGPFGLMNTGAICYLNSFLQMLASCSSLTKAVLGNEEYLSRTKTGAAVAMFVRSYAQKDGAAPDTLRTDIGNRSAEVLRALVSDLRVRRPRVVFGAGQESASEALHHLLDMMEPPDDAPENARDEDSTLVRSVNSPITRLFLHRFRCNIHCRACKQVVSQNTDYAVNFNLFHLDSLKIAPNPQDFSKAVRLQVSSTTDYECPACRVKTTAFRVYNLTMIPEIIFCMFNLYVEYGGTRVARYVPDRLEFPSMAGGKLVFRLVGQVEHGGSLAGGHYWARGLRAGERVYLLNDSSVTISSFAPTPYTYIVVFHFEREEAPAPPEKRE